MTDTEQHKTDGYPTVYDRCVPCGAEPGELCTYITGDGSPEEVPGSPRPVPHFYRAWRPPADHLHQETSR